MEYTREQVAHTLGLPLGGKHGVGRHQIKTRASRYARLGFLPEERYFLVEFTTVGRKSPLMIAIQRHRWSNNANRIKSHWSWKEYRLHIVQEYVKLGFRDKGKYESYRHYFLTLFREYILYFKDRIPRLPSYVYPEKQRIRKIPKAQKTKLKALKDTRNKYNTRIVRASMVGDQRERRRLEGLRNTVEKRIARIEGKGYLID